MLSRHIYYQKLLHQTPKFCSRLRTTARLRLRVYSLYKRFVTALLCLIKDQSDQSVSIFITESLAQRLRLVRINRSVCITGISAMQSVHHAVQITITPAYRNGFAYWTIALILRLLIKYLLDRINIVYNWKHIAGLKFTDSDSMNSDSIDIIIGADLFGMLVLNDVRKDSENEPTA